MKALFFLLLFANVTIAIYIQSGIGSASSSPLPAELHPEKIRLLPTPAATSPAAACLEWGNFSGADLQRAETAVAKLQLGDDLSRHAVGEVAAYWVHIPPLKTRPDAAKKIEELKKLGITSHFLIQDNSKWNNAISLEIFRSEETAQKFMAELKSKGVRSAIIGERSLKQVAFVINKPAEDVVEKMIHLQQEFPSSELKASECKVAAPSL